MKTRYLFLVLFLLISSFAHAQEVSVDAARSAGSDPSDDTSTTGNDSFEADYFTGAATKRITVELPPGRLGLTPQLVLEYNSHRRNRGSSVGFGWDLNPGTIERGRAKGVDFAGQDFLFTANGQRRQLIVNTNPAPGGCQEYNAKIETGDFTRYLKCGDSWTTIDRAGRKSLYGVTPDARNASADGTRIFRWYLERITDLNGNDIAFEYRHPLSIGDNAEVVLARVRYTGHPSLNGAYPFVVEFDYTNPTNDNILHPEEFSIVNHSFLHHIRVIGQQGREIRNYTLGYEMDEPSGVVLLHSLVLTATNGQQTVTLPTKTFDYSSHDTTTDIFGSAMQVHIANANDDLSQVDSAHGFMDVNGDGFVDRVVGQPGNHLFDVSFGSPFGFGARHELWRDKWALPGLDGQIFGQTQNISARLLDMNGDGLPDRVYTGATITLADGSVVHGFVVNYNSGHDWHYGETWHDPLCDLPTLPCGQLTSDVLLIDLTGDGLPDRVHVETNAFKVYRNTGHGFAASPEAWADPAAQYRATAFLRDMNGDHLPDRVVLGLFGGAHWIWVYPHTGHGWSATPAATMRDPAGRSTINDETDLIDINNDGMADRVVGDPARRQIHIYYNAGEQFEVPHHLVINDPARSLLSGKISYSGVPGLVDINGDGFLDRFVPDGQGGADVAYYRSGRGESLYLLQRIDNGLGAVTTLTYRPASRYTNHLLPSALQVIYEISTREANATQTTNIRYAGGYFYGNFFNPLGHKFSGFHFVEIRDPLGTITQQWYRQPWDVVTGNLFVVPDHTPTGFTDPIPVTNVTEDDRAQGRLLLDPWGGIELSGKLLKETVFFDPHDGRPLQKHHTTINDWRTLFQLSGSSGDLAYLQQTDRYDYPGNTSPRHVQKEWTYDPSTGNLSTATDRGELGIDSLHTQELSNYLSIADPLFGTVLTKWPRTVIARENSVLRNSTERVIDARGNVRRVTQLLIDPRGQRNIVTELTPDAFGNVIAVTDPLGSTTSFVYETAYNTYPQFERVTVDGKLFETSRDYDGSIGKITKMVTPDRRVHVSRYDPLGRLTERSLNGVWQERFEYVESLSRPGLAGAFLSQLKRYTNVTGDAVSTLLPREVRYRDGRGRLLLSSVRSERVNGAYRAVATAYRADRQNNIVYTYEPVFVANADFVPAGGAYAAKVSDSLSRVIQVDPVAGDATSPTAPMRTAYVFQQDPWTTVSVDELGHIKRAVRNGRGQLKEVVEPGNRTTRYRYDFWGHRIGIDVNGGHSTTLVYDNLGRKVSESNMDRGNWSYFYDDGGNLTKVIDARGVNAIYGYDELHRLRTRHVRGPGVTPEMATYTYDVPASGSNHQVRLGELGEVIDAHGVTQFGYDTLGYVEKTERHTQGLSGPAVTQYLRGVDGRVVEMTYPGGRMHLRYDYDAAGNVKLVTRLGSPDVELYRIAPDSAYDERGHLLQATYGNAVEESYRYYPNSKRLLGTRDVRAGEVLRDKSYAYNASGDLTASTDLLNTSADLNNATIANVSYDDLHRVTGYDYYQGAATNQLTAETYDYDALGNFTINGESFGAVHYSYRIPDHANAMKSIGRESFAYDANGNMTRGRGRTLVFDATNQLARVELDNGMQVEYGYGGLSERLFKKISQPDGSIKTTFTVGNHLEIQNGLMVHNIYAGDRLIATIGEGQWSQGGGPQVGMMWRKDQDNLRDYFFGPTLSFIGFTALAPLIRRRRKIGEAVVETIEQLGMNTGRKLVIAVLLAVLMFPATAFAYVFPSDVEDTWPRPDEYFFLYIHTDHLRSSNLMTEGRNQTTHNGIRFIKGEVVQRIEYTPFGKARYVLNPTLEQSPKYTDQVYDVEDGLYFYQSRYYDAVLGRFIQPDTIAPETLNPQTINPYAYVLNNPLKYIDPTGHFADVYTDVPEERGGLSAHTDPVNVGEESGIASHLSVFSFSEEEKARQMELAFEFATFSGGLSFEGGAVSAVSRFGEFLSEKLGGWVEKFRGLFGREVANEIPETLARAIAGDKTPTTLGPLGNQDVFVTAAEDIAGLNAKEIAERLSLKESETFTIIEFKTPESGLASPVGRTDPGFIGGGRTGGGAREFVLPNGPIPPNVKIRIVR